MTDRIVKTITDPHGHMRVHVIERSDHLCTYAIELRDVNAASGWGGLGPHCGLYDSAETAEKEAILNTWWSNNELAVSANTRIPE